MVLLQNGSFVSLELLVIVALAVIQTVVGLLFVIRDKRKEDATE